MAEMSPIAGVLIIPTTTSMIEQTRQNIDKVKQISMSKTSEEFVVSTLTRFLKIEALLFIKGNKNEESGEIWRDRAHY